MSKRVQQLLLCLGNASLAGLGFHLAASPRALTLSEPSIQQIAPLPPFIWLTFNLSHPLPVPNRRDSIELQSSEWAVPSAQ